MKNVDKKLFTSFSLGNVFIDVGWFSGESFAILRFILGEFNEDYKVLFFVQVAKFCFGIMVEEESAP